MGKTLKKWLESMRMRWRLHKIEKAIGYRLVCWQRKYVLNNEPPDGNALLLHGRRSGKTITAIIWAMLWRKEPISRVRELEKTHLGNGQPWRYYDDRNPAIPDPDATNMMRMDHTLRMYKEMSRKCAEAGIEVPQLRH